MQYPLIDKELFAPLRLSHGVYNLFMLLLFLHQGFLGLRVRRARKAHAPLPFPAIKRHRKGGPVLAGMGAFGFLFGLVLILLDTGNILEYPPHFFAGCLIVLALVAGIVTSGRIKGQDPIFRNRHFAAGIVILCLYVLNSLLGLGVLL